MYEIDSQTDVREDRWPVCRIKNRDYLSNYNHHILIFLYSHIVEDIDQFLLFG